MACCSPAKLWASTSTPRRGARRFAPQQGRGARLTFTTAGGPFTVIDESYNANPASMRAALALLGRVEPAPMGGASR